MKSRPFGPPRTIATFCLLTGLAIPTAVGALAGLLAPSPVKPLATPAPSA